MPPPEFTQQQKIKSGWVPVDWANTPVTKKDHTLWRLKNRASGDACLAAFYTWVRSGALVPQGSWFHKVEVGEGYYICGQGSFISTIRDYDMGAKGVRAKLLQPSYGIEVRADARGEEKPITLVSESPAFQAWFGASKVTDAEGRPVPVFHGTDRKFRTFDTKRSLGVVWFASNRQAIEGGEVGAAGKGHIMEMYARILKPAGWKEYERYGLWELKSQGYDGVILPDPDGTFTGFVLNSNQLKSVKNKGAFDGTKGNVYAAAAPTPALQQWFGGSQVGTATGPKVVYHGTTHDFSHFDVASGNSENHYGPAFYFTDSQEDAVANYAGEGPDLTSRIEDRMEEMIDMRRDEGGFEEPKRGSPEYEALQEEVREAAKAELKGTHGGMVMPCYLKITKPVIVQPKGGTYFEINYNERTGKVSGTALRLWKGFIEAANALGLDGEECWGRLQLDSEFTAAEFDRAVRQDSNYIDEDVVAGTLVANTFRQMGFDGIIMDANAAFGHSGGGGMTMPPGTKHYIVWKPTQIKSALGNSGKFNPRKKEITARFLMTARPTDRKIEYLANQFKVTKEQVEECVELDPSPNQTDFVPWIVRQLSKGQLRLPEDGERVKDQLTTFQKLKRSPNFQGNKDINSYTPGTLFEALEKNSRDVSKKEQERETVIKGAQIIVQQGDIKAYKVTESKALMSLSGGTNWCTAQKGMADHYLQRGPSYVIFYKNSAYAQLHPASDQCMDRRDTPIVESIPVGGYPRPERVSVLFDETTREAVELIAAKEPDVRAWFEENSTPIPEVIKKLEGQKKTPAVALRLALLSGIPLSAEDVAAVEALDPKVLSADVDLLTKYSGRFLNRQRWQPLEKALLARTPSEAIVRYATRNVGGRWPEGEKFLLRFALKGSRNMEYCLEYTTSVVKGRWKELEDKFYKAKPDAGLAEPAFKYAKDVIGGRWPQPARKEDPTANGPEVIICGSSAYGQMYAREVVQGRWPLFEQMAGHADDKHQSVGSKIRALISYSEKVAKTRVPSIETAILGFAANRPEWREGSAYAEYAERVVGGRWKELEVALLSLLPKLGDHRVYSYRPTDFSKTDKWDRFTYEHLPESIRDYLTEVIKDRWPELEKSIVGVYKKPDGWAQGQYLMESYLLLLKDLGKDWPEGEAKLHGRDANYEKQLLKKLAPTRENTRFGTGGMSALDYLTDLKGNGKAWPEGVEALRRFYDAVEKASNDKERNPWAEQLDEEFPRGAEVASQHMATHHASPVMARFLRRARPSDIKIENVKRQFKLTDEQVEQVIAADPSRNQTDYFGWIAKQLHTKTIRLPEDAEKVKQRLTQFEKLKKSPHFTGNKDIQGYTPSRLVELLEPIDGEDQATLPLSGKEQARQRMDALLRGQVKGAKLMFNGGGVVCLEVTEVPILMELSNSTEWCTRHEETAKTYLSHGPDYVFYKEGKPYAQWDPGTGGEQGTDTFGDEWEAEHYEQFMNRRDESILLDDLEPYRVLADESLKAAIKSLAEHGVDEADGLQFLSDTGDKVLFSSNQGKTLRNFIKADRRITPTSKEEDVLVRALSMSKSERLSALNYCIRFRVDLTETTKQAVRSADLPVEQSARWATAVLDQSDKNLERSILALAEKSVGYIQPPVMEYVAKFHNPWPELQQALLAEPTYRNGLALVAYCQTVLKGRSPEIEEALLAYDEAGIGKSPFTARTNSPTMASVQILTEYAVRVIRARWLEAEKILLQRPIDVFGTYIEDLVHESWPEFEDVTLEALNDYVLNKVDFRTEGHRVCLNAMAYITHVLKDRWHALEELIKQKPVMGTWYREALEKVGKSWPENPAPRGGGRIGSTFLQPVPSFEASVDRMFRPGN